MKAYVLINVRAGRTHEVVQAVRQVEGIKSADACWGRPDVFALFDGPGLTEAVMGKIHSIEGVESTDTHYRDRVRLRSGSARRLRRAVSAG